MFSLAITLHPAKRPFQTTPTIYPFRAKNYLSTTVPAWGPRNPSKRDPTEDTRRQVADRLERIMDMNGHRIWGFVLYRCTYKSDSDWEKFMHQYLKPVQTSLKKNNGLDILDRFRPTVFEDQRFDGASSFTIRDHFNKWVATASQQEQGIPAEVALTTDPGRYQFCLMVDEESLQSVIDRPADMDEDDDERDHSAFVILVSGRWNPEMEEIDDEELEGYGGVYEPEVFDAVDGCTEWDVGCMRVRYNKIQLRGYVEMNGRLDWEMHYCRVPEVGFRY